MLILKIYTYPESLQIAKKIYQTCNQVLMTINDFEHRINADTNLILMSSIILTLFLKILRNLSHGQNDFKFIHGLSLMLLARETL